MKRKWKSTFQYAFQRSIPILIGYFALGTANGILMAAAGYGVGWTALASALLFSGTQQFLLSGWLAASVPLVTVIVTSILVGSRYLFYGVSFLDKFKPYGLWKYFLIHGLTDESYSLLCSYVPREDVDEKWVHIFSTALIWLYWIFASMFGCLAGTLLPFDLTGVDFAMTALFIVILIEQLESGDRRLPAVVAGVSSVVSLLLFGADNFLLPALIATVAALVALRTNLETEVPA